MEEDERSAAGGITNIVRSVGLSLAPLCVGYLLQDPSNRLMFGLPFIISGALKCFYDILLYIAFQWSGSNTGSNVKTSSATTTALGGNSSNSAVNTTQYQQVSTKEEETAK